MGSKNSYSITLAVLTVWVSSALGGADSGNFQNEKNLTAHYTSSPLPSSRYSISAAYDGNDSIYLFGGYGPSVYPRDEILRFNISTESVELVGRLEMFTTIGKAQWDKDGNILFFAGQAKTIFKFEPATGNFYVWNYSPENMRDATAERYNNDIYFFGGRSGNQESRVLSLDLNNDIFTIRKQLPILLGTMSSTRVGNQVFLRGQPYDGIGKPPLFIYNLDDGSITTGPDNYPKVSCCSFDQPMVNDKNHIYLMATHVDIPNQGVVQINTTSLEWKFIYINDWPLADYLTFQFPPASVYVPKVNRIYYFGGHVTSSNPITNIWYVDLADLD